MQNFRFIKNVYLLALPYKFSLFSGFFLMLLAAFFSLVPYYLIIELTNNILIPIQNGKEINITKVYFFISMLLVSSILSWICTSSKTLLLANISEKIGMNLRVKTFRHLLNLSLEYFNQQRIGDLISRIGNETDDLNFFISVTLLDFIQNITFVIFIFVAILSINYKLACITFISLPFVLMLIFHIKDKFFYAFEETQRMWSQLTSYISDAIHGIKIIKCFSQEDREFLKFKNLNHKIFKVNFHLNKIWSFFSPTTTLLNEINVIIIWFIGIRMMMTHEINLGELTGLTGYLANLYSRTESMSRFLEFYKKSAVKLKRILEVLDEPIIEINRSKQINLPFTTGDIRIENMSFSYDGKSVLKKINLHILPNQKIGFVGYSGAGKTTLMNLVCRFLKPSDGAIYLDNHEIDDINMHDFRKHIVIVPQEPFLFYGTIADNISYGKPDASPEDIIEAATKAKCHDFIIKKPLAYDTILQENANILSGGEKQRLSIARAILAKAKILILDEATSSVDVETEHLLHLALNNLTKDVTTLVISHRLSNLNQYNQIVFLNDGEIVEVGTHQELLQKNSHYAKFIQIHHRLHKDEPS